MRLRWRAERGDRCELVGERGRAREEGSKQVLHLQLLSLSPLLAAAAEPAAFKSGHDYSVSVFVCVGMRRCAAV